MIFFISTAVSRSMPRRALMRDGDCPSVDRLLVLVAIRPSSCAAARAPPLIGSQHFLTDKWGEPKGSAPPLPLSPNRAISPARGRWQGRQDSNPQPAVLETAALPN
ncbi:hypothetical protein NITHO_810002 [Nitrolancea hollandica Lb]|uniref:Uncharacterized protein n=1 Tax=Nitrolancea hollandica Lb TaxID=1129897 RepID=I4EN95_9BACT|nr:hypothetical protein NITHO_810002 [Nitrolancea hollandica Lb]